jgi:nicotinamidase-related amidase
MQDVVLAVDLLDDFRHANADALLASFRDRADGMRLTLAAARRRSVPIIYANDNRGIWDGDRHRLVQTALDGAGGEVLRSLAPEADDRFVVKPRYSAFDLTPLEPLLDGLRAERIVLLGSTTEMCVAQTAIDARERDLKVTVIVDACACVDATMERVALDYLEGVAGVMLARAPFF